MLMNNNEYLDLVQTIKQEIQQAQYKATLSVNKELIMLYYNIGKIINEHKSWGNKFIENLAADIKLSFPNAKGYSVRNLKYMSKFASTYPDEQFVQTVSAQIPWSHNVAILDKVKGEKQREWYIRKTAENGWSHNVLIHQIESGLYERQASTLLQDRKAQSFNPSRTGAVFKLFEKYSRRTILVSDLCGFGRDRASSRRTYRIKMV